MVENKTKSSRKNIQESSGTANVRKRLLVTFINSDVIPVNGLRNMKDFLKGVKP